VKEVYTVSLTILPVPSVQISGVEAMHHHQFWCVLAFIIKHLSL